MLICHTAAPYMVMLLLPDTLDHSMFYQTFSEIIKDEFIRNIFK